MTLLAIFLGGGAGSVCRFILGTVVQGRSQSQFPYGTLVVNVVGCLAMGILARHFLPNPTQNLPRVGLIVGFWGGFTTFSAFTFETFGLWSIGKPLAAFAYVAASLVLCLLGTMAGYSLLPVLTR
jgi:CrcB protein